MNNFYKTYHDLKSIFLKKDPLFVKLFFDKVLVNDSLIVSQIIDFSRKYFINTKLETDVYLKSTMLGNTLNLNKDFSYSNDGIILLPFVYYALYAYAKDGVSAPSKDYFFLQVKQICTLITEKEEVHIGSVIFTTFLIQLINARLNTHSINKLSEKHITHSLDQTFSFVKSKFNKSNNFSALAYFFEIDPSLQINFSKSYNLKRLANLNISGSNDVVNIIKLFFKLIGINNKKNAKNLLNKITNKNSPKYIIGSVVYYLFYLDSYKQQKNEVIDPIIEIFRQSNELTSKIKSFDDKTMRDYKQYLKEIYGI